jgi:hypothetical protein
MDSDDLVDLINQQILVAEAQFAAQVGRGERTEGTVGLLRSLRLTLRALSAGMDPEDEAATSFVLTVSEEGQILLRRDSRLVGLSGCRLPSLLEHAGISLVPGQVLLIEPEFARRAIEDSLGMAAEEGFRLGKKKEELRGALEHSPDDSKDSLLLALGELEEREADLVLDQIDLGEFNALVAQMLSGGTASGEAA